MAGTVSVFLRLNEASIYTFLDLAFDLVDLVLWGGLRTPSHHTHFKLLFESEVHLDQLFAKQGLGQRSKKLMIFLDELTQGKGQGSCSRVLQNNPPQRGGCSSLFPVSL